MKHRVALLALLCMSTPAMAVCHTPAYLDKPGSRAVSLTILPLSAALTVLTLPTGIIGAATRNETLMEGTSDTVCYTRGFATHAIVGNR
jgi:hypothetical protein